MNDFVNAARSNISEEGGNELKSIVNNDGLRDLFLQRQNLIKEMNAARQEAIAKVDLLYKDRLEEIDRMYAMTLMMLGGEKNTDWS